MRRISVSVLTIFIALPAFANARLPVVNVAAGSVSARAAFGVSDVAAPREKQNNVAVVAATKPKPTDVPASKTAKKTVVARSGKKAANVGVKKSSADSGEQIIAAADVLSPRRPSADLWAKNDTPLRLPQPDEFSVIRADYDLPEEDLNAGPIAPQKTVVARAAVKSAPAPAAPTDTPMAEIDTQIARLVELQRRADESVRSAPVARVAERDVAPMPVVAKNNNIAPAPVAAVDNPEPVRVSRMVVPMESDVVVRSVEKNASPRITAVRDDMTKMNPAELRKAFRKTFLSENKHLSTFQIDDRFDVASDMTTNAEGFTAKRDLSEAGGIRPLEIKIRFRNDDSALSRENYNLLSEYAAIVVSNPKRAIQIAIPQSVARNMDERKLAARRLALVEQVLRDTGVSEQRILPVLSARDDDGFVLRVISSDQYETLTRKQRDMFGDTVSKKTYKSMSW